MEAAYDILVFVHVLTGAVGLLLLVIPLLARKGSRVHRSAGWAFGLAMALSMVTALAISASWIAAPQAIARWRDGDPVRAVTVLRVFGLFFGLLGLLGMHTLASGLQAIGRRRRSWRWLAPLVRRLAIATAVAGPAVLVIGLFYVKVLLLVVGAMGTWAGVAALRSTPQTGPSTVLLAHVEGMLGVATVATTAFFVQLTSRLGAHTFALWVWAVPLVAGHLATVLWQRRVRAGQYTA